MTGKPPQVYQIKVTLGDTHPPIWRRILVSGNTTQTPACISTLGAPLTDQAAHYPTTAPARQTDRTSRKELPGRIHPTEDHRRGV